jgi:hypothetical protein
MIEPLDGMPEGTVFAVGPGFEEFEPGALVEDAKVGVTLGCRRDRRRLDQEGDPHVRLAHAR